jgi:hypothetical protein
VDLFTLNRVEGKGNLNLSSVGKISEKGFICVALHNCTSVWFYRYDLATVFAGVSRVCGPMQPIRDLPIVHPRVVSSHTSKPACCNVQVESINPVE